MSNFISGSCLCKQVTFTISKEAGKVIFCHCSLCRKHNSSFFASVGVRADKVEIKGDENIRWYLDSSNASRGFCINCGTSLFWKSGREKYAMYLDIAAGAIDTPEKLKGEKHIYCASKAGYYSISDNLPKFDEGDEGGE
ncbi:MAG: GFA family protein [Methyloligellaceae bacterium]